MPKRTRKPEDEPIRGDLPAPDELHAVDSYTPPSHANEAADHDQPHEETRPETRAESRDRRREETA